MNWNVCLNLCTGLFVSSTEILFDVNFERVLRIVKQLCELKNISVCCVRGPPYT